MTNLPKLVIWGASGHARVVADIVRLESRYAIAGFLDDIAPQRRGSEFAGACVLGGSEALPELRRSGVGHLLVAIGDCAARSRLAAQARELGFTLPAAIHPKAVVAADVPVARARSSWPASWSTRALSSATRQSSTQLRPSITTA